MPAKKKESKAGQEDIVVEELNTHIHVYTDLMIKQLKPFYLDLYLKSV